MMAAASPSTPLHGMEQVNGVTERLAVPTGWIYRFPRSDTFVPDPDADHVRELARQRSEERRAAEKERATVDLPEYPEGWPTLEGMTPWRRYRGHTHYTSSLPSGYLVEVFHDGWEIYCTGIWLAKGDEPWLAGARMAVGWLAKRTGAKLVDATD